MVDLMGQYSKIKNEIDRNIISSIESGDLPMKTGKYTKLANRLIKSFKNNN